MFWLQFAVVIAAMFVGARKGGIFLGMAGGLGLAVLVFGFGLTPSSPPIDVMLIIFAVITAASTLQAAGGMDFLIKVAEYLLRKHPQHISFMAPFIAYTFTFLAGTGNIAYSIMPIIAEVARESGVRPERPMGISVIASQQAITASPISAATAAMVALMMPLGVSMGSILAICIPATLIGVLCACFYSCRVGVELDDDPEYQRRLREGLCPPVVKKEKVEVTGSPEAKRSIILFLMATFCIVIMGTIPDLRPDFMVDGKSVKLAMTHTIEIIMLVVAGIIVLTCKVEPNKIILGTVFRTGMMGLVCIFGLAWLGDTFVQNNLPFIRANMQDIVAAHPWTFAFALFIVSGLITSQAGTTRALMPLGISLGMPATALVGVWPAVNGYFFIPNYATLIAGVAFDSTGTTRIGKYVFNHSYMIPGLIATIVSVSVALAIGSVIL